MSADPVIYKKLRKSDWALLISAITDARESVEVSAEVDKDGKEELLEDLHRIQEDLNDQGDQACRFLKVSSVGREVLKSALFKEYARLSKRETEGDAAERLHASHRLLEQLSGDVAVLIREEGS